ncbi:hypothetical protein P2318_02350 [Myxococcaceae bacterium GXIMD 01537]
MLKTQLNEWSLKAIQLDTALMALQEVELPEAMRELQDDAEEKLTALLDAWREHKPAAEPRTWKKEVLKQGAPKDAELAEAVKDFKEEKQDWTLHRATSDKNEVIETLVSEGKALMVAGGEHYFGQWDDEALVLEVLRDDETGEPGTGLVLTVTGEVVLDSDVDE